MCDGCATFLKDVRKVYHVAQFFGFLKCLMTMMLLLNANNE